MKHFIITIFIFNSLLLSKSFNIEFNGQLDDDLFIIKSTPQETSMVSAMQMHNPSKFFYYLDTTVESEKIYGILDIDKKFEIKEDEIYIIALGNEREELRPENKLHFRTHFKADDLLVNSKIFIPSLLPEKDDAPKYPTWFQNKEDICVNENNEPSQINLIYNEYNYYNLWENAIISLGIILPEEGNIKIEWMNLDGNKIFEYNYLITNTIQNIQPTKNFYKLSLNTHQLTEANGQVFSINKKMDDDKIIELSANDLIITYKNKKYYIDMPYPMPYINRIFTKSLK